MLSFAVLWVSYSILCALVLYELNVQFVIIIIKPLPILWGFALAFRMKIWCSETSVVWEVLAF